MSFACPPTMQSAAQPDEMTVQTELPSEAAARAYALENPPTMALKPDINADATPMSDATPDIANDLGRCIAPDRLHHPRRRR